MAFLQAALDFGVAVVVALALMEMEAQITLGVLLI
jgi:hypothetical protein